MNFTKQVVLISINEILVNPENPRHDPVIALDESIIMQQLISNKNDAKAMHKLIMDIYNNGWFPQSIITVTYEENSKKYIAWDGNRRITALKILQNPQLTENLKYFNHSQIANIYSMAKGIKDSSFFTVSCFVADNFDFKAYKGFIYDVSKHDDINELYILADILITDYSSVFFDYAILERPMLFYMYDMEEYRDEMRGFYLDVKELPGPVMKTEKELVKAVKTAEVSLDDELIKNFNKEYNTLNDGMAAERLVNIIISNCRKNS